MYATAWRFLNYVLEDQEIDDFFVTETSRSLRKVYFESATSTPEVSVTFSNGGQIDFADSGKQCRFQRSFCLPLYSDDSARVTMEFLDLFYYAVRRCMAEFSIKEKDEGRVPRLKLYGMVPAIQNWHDEADFSKVDILLVLGMYEDFR